MKRDKLIAGLSDMYDEIAFDKTFHQHDDAEELRLQRCLTLIDQLLEVI